MMKGRTAAWWGLGVFGLVLLFSCTRKAPEIEWQLNLGGSLLDEAHCIRQTADGAYVGTGIVNSLDGDVAGNHGATDFMVFSLSKQGEVLRNQCFGGDYFDIAALLAVTSDGGFIVAGHTYSFTGDVQGNHGGSDIWVLRFDKDGMVKWKKALGGSGHEYATGILQNKDGTTIIGGQTNSNDGDVSSNFGNEDGWLVKLDDSGNLVWQKSIGGPLKEVFSPIAATVDGGFILIERL